MEASALLAGTGILSFTYWNNDYWEKLYKCDVSIFRPKKHKRTHFGEKLFKCYVCDSAFTRPGSLKIHKFTLTVEKPFKCVICKYLFSRLEILNAFILDINLIIVMQNFIFPIGGSSNT